MMFSTLVFALTTFSLANSVSGIVFFSEITYAVSTNPNSISQNFVTPIEKVKIKKQRPVIFIIHGMGDFGNNSWIRNLTEIFLKNIDCSVVSVDWKKPAKGPYPKALKNVKQIGEIVGDVIVDLVEEGVVSLNQLHIIGHSLGAHIVGFVGQTVKEKIGSLVAWITGLDPSRYYYDMVFWFKRLSKDDGEVVEIVHTDGGIFGFQRPLGTIDFYPNGGEYIQPNCSLSEATHLRKMMNYVSCSHHKSWQYYTIALKNGGYQATRCSSWWNYQRGVCEHNEEETFGSFKPPKHRGKYYFKISGTVLDIWR